MSKKKKLGLFSFNYFIVFIGMGLTYCMMISYLISLSYTAIERSFMYAFGAVLTMMVQFIIGYLCDKYKTIKRYAIFLMGVYIIIAVSLYFYQRSQFIMHFVLVGTNITMMRVMMGLMDSWTIETGETCKKNYGAIRAFGSIGWALGSFLASQIIARWNYSMIGLVFSLIGVVAIAAFAINEDAIKPANQTVTFHDLKNLLQNPGYMLLMGIFFCVLMMQSSLDYTMVDKLEGLQASSSQISFYWSLTAIVELPLFFLGGWCLQKFSKKTLLLVSIIAYSLRLVLYSLAQSVDVMLWISLLQIITYPIISIVSKLMIDDETPVHLRSSGQQVALAIYSSFSALLSPLLAGCLEEKFGIDYAIFIISLFGILAFILTIFYGKYRKLHDNHQ